MATFCIILSAFYSSVLSFQQLSTPSRTTNFLMAGGRSLEEKSMTTRGMFKELRKKLNSAAEIPGFFDVGEGTPVSIITSAIKYHLMWVQTG